MNNVCPLCEKKLGDKDLLLLEHIPQYGTWMLMHLKPEDHTNSGASEASFGHYQTGPKLKGYRQWCARSGYDEPKYSGGITTFRA